MRKHIFCDIILIYGDRMKKRKWNAPLLCFFIFTLVIVGLFVQLCYLALSKKVYGINMQEFAKGRNTVTSVLEAKRGTIYDIEGNVLAQNITTYTLIAYLDSTRTVDENDPKHVVDKEYTAEKLATILGEENREYILERLNKKAKQVEFGNVGRNITELTKLAIEELDLPGIDFTETIKRYYPNGDFASYVIGYAKQYTRINIKEKEEYDLGIYYKSFFENYSGITIEVSNDLVVELKDKIIFAKEEGTSLLFIKTYGETLATIVVNVTEYDTYNTMDTTIVGELGIESQYDKDLQGKDGYTKYQQDKYGYKIPETPEETIEAEDGIDIYLTIDSNIQRFAENATNDLVQNYEPEWSIISVMDAKTGDILASSTSPSYNPNSLPDNMSYENPLVSYVYEPGSVMKTYTFMCALETGKYDGTKTYKSGSYEFNDGTVISDWNPDGWGYLTFDQAFPYSSNVGIINIINNYLSLKQLNSCLQKYGFGSKTGVELSGELSGKLGFKYETELMAAGYGQGISTTPVQQLQALTIIANDGVMIKPHIIKKIVNTETGEEKETKVVKSEKLVSTKTVNKIKDLMRSVVDPTSATANRYYIEGYEIIGKTGTAQIFSNGKYLDGQNQVITSIALMFPKDDPQIIIYAAAKRPTHSGIALSKPVTDLIKNISKYKNIYGEDEEEKSEEISYTTETYINKKTEDVKNYLAGVGLDPIIIGKGNKIIKQYPLKGIKVVKGDKILLLTNSNEYEMPNMINWSKLDVSKYCEFLNMECIYNGYGYVKEQSIPIGVSINETSKLEVNLENINEKKEIQQE